MRGCKSSEENYIVSVHRMCDVIMAAPSMVSRSMLQVFHPNAALYPQPLYISSSMSHGALDIGRNNKQSVIVRLGSVRSLPLLTSPSISPDEATGGRGRRRSSLGVARKEGLRQEAPSPPSLPREWAICMVAEQVK